MASRSDSVVCTLSTSAAGDRLVEWSDLQRVAWSIEQLDDGARLRLPVSLANEARDLAVRESQCCSFLEIEVTDVDEAIEMTIRSPNPDGVAVVHLLAGLAEQ